MKTTTHACDLCDGGTLRPVTFSCDLQHAGHTLKVDGLEGYQCDRCGADPVFPDQIRRNDTRIADARRAADGMLTGDAIRAVRERYQLTQELAAILFGGGVQAFSKYERGVVTQSDAMDRLIRLVDADPLNFARLVELAVERGQWEAAPRTTWTNGRAVRFAHRETSMLRVTAVAAKPQAAPASEVLAA